MMEPLYQIKRRELTTPSTVPEVPLNMEPTMTAAVSGLPENELVTMQNMTVAF
jgi:hypothetical protein